MQRGKCAAKTKRCISDDDCVLTFCARSTVEENLCDFHAAVQRTSAVLIDTFDKFAPQSEVVIDVEKDIKAISVQNSRLLQQIKDLTQTTSVIVQNLEQRILTLNQEIAQIQDKITKQQEEQNEIKSRTEQKRQSNKAALVNIEQQLRDLKQSKQEKQQELESTLLQIHECENTQRQLKMAADRILK